MVRLQKDRIPAIELDRHGCNELTLKGIRQRNARIDIRILGEKKEMRTADLDAIAVLEFFRAGGLSVDESAVQAVEVGHVDFGALVLNTTMPARNERIVQRHLIGRIAANNRLGINERNGRPLERTRYRHEPWFHRGPYRTRKILKKPET
jgi:hypothetical protein